MNLFTRRQWAAVVCSACLLCSAARSLGDVPRQIHYQGKLRTLSGTAVSGAVELRLRLYDAPTGGTDLFDETHAGVAVNNGLFSVLIGSQAAGGIPDSAVDAPAVYLGVSIEGGSELLPRTRLAGTAHSLKSGASERLVRPDSYEPEVSVSAAGAVGVGTNAPDASAKLDIQSTSQGLLIPRMTTVQRDAIGAPATSLLIYNSESGCFEFFAGGVWQTMFCACTGAPTQPGEIQGPAVDCSPSEPVQYAVGAVFGASSYQWTVPDGATIVSGQGTANIEAMLDGASGEIAVAAHNACGTGPARTLAVTSESQPIAPTAIAPTGVTPDSFNANWSASAGATGYHLDVATDALFTQFASGYEDLDAGNVTSFPVTGLQSGLTYYYRIRALSENCVSDHSNVISQLTPTSQVFHCTGSNQTFGVPTGVTSLSIKLWGAGGSGGNNSNTPGGGGGFVSGNLAVTPGQTLTVIAGCGGVYTAQTRAYGGGGASSASSGGGGGRSAIRNGAAGNPPDLITAGAGGAGGDVNTQGGPGGGLNGLNGNATSPGGGGTQSSGGAAGNGDCSSSNTNAGAQYQGGDTWSTWGTGAGGGGWYGGGSGGYTCGQWGSGGGGSSYYGGAGVTGGNTSAGSGTTPGNNGGTDYEAGVGVGGASFSNGGHGLIVVRW